MMLNLGKFGRMALTASMMMALALITMPAAPAQTYMVIYTFTGGADGGTPFSAPILFNGNLWGTTNAGGANAAGTIYTVNFKNRKETVLHSFAGGPTDGAGPIAGLTQDANGNFFGVSYKGGAHNFGTVFELKLNGQYTIEHSFAGPPGEGLGPAGTPIFDPLGNMYGTTYQGGSTKGYGTTWEITKAGVFKTGQNFPVDGALPRAGLTLIGTSLYGTSSGGTTRQYGGAIYVAKVAAPPPLYLFTGGADGSQPMGPVVGDGMGNLYGTTSGGGNGDFGNGNGVVYKFNIATGVETVLHTFTGPDGSVPMSGLSWDTQGHLYGTTLYGGAFGYGTVFKVDPAGTLTTVYSFTGGADGANPIAGVFVDNAGNIWGAASAGGSGTGNSGYGTLFIITPAAS